MTTMRWFLTGATPRGTPVFRRPTRRHPVVLLTLAVVTLGLTGCQSGPLGPCSPCGSRLRSLSERAFRPFRGAGPCCGSDLGVEASPLPYAAPAVVAPVAPSAPAGTTTVPSQTDSMPAPLEPIPSAAPGPPASGGDSSPSQGAKATTGKANYEAYRALGRNRTTSSLDPSPEPTTRSAQGSARSAREASPLDNLPPLDLPRQALAPDATPTPSRDTTAPAASNPAPAPAETLAEVAAREASRDRRELSVAPGIRRFAGVESKLSGGSLPSPQGLDWLVEKGYKTVLDLREETEMSSTFIADVARRGMRYVALPITANSVDADHVDRFNFELSLADARPLYFFDKDGARAGLMWYVHRVLIDRVDPQVARRDAEDLGLIDPQFLLAADTYLKSRRPAPVSGDRSQSASNLPAPAPADTPSRPGPAPATGNNAPPAPSAGPAPGGSADAASAPAPQDPTAWKSLAALVVTGLGVPLAYISRSAIPASVATLARASLPGPRRTPKSLPGRSDG